MLLKLILLFTIIPFIELIFLIEIGSRIGTLNTVMIVIVTGIVGAFMARIAGFSVLLKIQQNLRPNTSFLTWLPTGNGSYD